MVKHLHSSFPPWSSSPPRKVDKHTWALLSEGFPSSHRLTFSVFSAHRNNGNRAQSSLHFSKWCTHTTRLRDGRTTCHPPSLLSSQPCLFGLLDAEYGEGCCFLGKMEETAAWVNSELPIGSGNYVFWQFTYTCVYII